MMFNIPIMDISASYDEIYDEIISKIKYLLDTTQFIGGEEVDSFEREFAAYCRVNYAVGCGNGTDALTIALHALGLGVNDTVVTVPNTFIATAESITNIGARVDFVDIDDKSYTMDPDKLRDYLINNKYNKNVKAIIPVHLYGQMAEMDKIRDIADEFDIKVIEDSSQAHGASYKRKGPGDYGHVATFSFYPGKNLGAFGDAGAIITNDEKIAKKAKMLTNHGRVEKYIHEIEGYNSRLDSIQAAVLRVKLKHLDKWNTLRINNAKLYNELLNNSKIQIPTCRVDTKHVYHLYVCRMENRNEIRKELKNKGILTEVHYPVPLHLQPAYSYLGYKEGDFPITEKICKEIISLPMWPQLEEKQIQLICKTLIDLL